MSRSKKIDWLNHLLEFTVVVIGILLAFQLNTCREDRKESTLVNEHIKNIIEESEFNQRNLEYAIHYSDTLLNAIDTLLVEFRGDENVAKMNRLSMQILSINPLYIKKNAYSSLKESGDIRFIKDFDLKNEIILLYEYYSWAEGVDKVTMNTYQDYYYPYMVKNLDLMQGEVQTLENYTNKEFKNIVAGYRYTLAMRLKQNKETLSKINAFLESRKEEK
jgi:ribosomal protein S17E